MKKFINLWFTKPLQALTLALLFTPLFFSCGDKNTPEETPKSSEKIMSNVKVNVTNPAGQFNTELSGSTFVFLYPMQADVAPLAKANVTFTLSEGAESSPKSGEEVNLSTAQGAEFTVTAEDGSTTKYVVKMSRESSSEAKITSFSVTIDGEEFDGDIDDDMSTITVEITSEAWEMRDDAVATFDLSLGASANPPSPATLDFTKEVKIVVTANDGSKRTWTINCVTAGFKSAVKGVTKNFVELGYPGQYGVFDGSIPSIQYGDLLVYHAYCGDNIVLVSRVYIETDVASPHCVKVVNKNTLESAGNLNLGSITLANLKMITSDYKGRCVAAVTNGTETEFFYWTTTTAAPTSVGKMNVDIATAPSALVWNSGAGMDNFQVAGDITGNAWITARAPSSAKGEHYRIKVTGGQLASSHSIVETGYSSDDCTKFQMISPMDDSDQPNFVVGDTEGAVASAGSVKCYINNWNGETTSVMPGFWQGNAGFPNWPAEGWAQTGVSPQRAGGRCPVVSALPINGKTYVAVTSGSNWWYTAAVLEPDLKSWVNDDLTICFDLTTGYSFGSWIDWYANDELKEAYLAVWHGRHGLITFKMTW